MKQKRSYFEKSKELVIRQHQLHQALRLLVERNGTECYIEDRERTQKVVKHYIRRFHLHNTIVEQFWTFMGSSVLSGKAL